MKVSVIVGTRPEAIKMAPVVLALRADPTFKCEVCSTGQHRQMLDQVFDVFGIRPDTDLNLMVQNQTLAGLTSKAIEALDRYIAEAQPDLVLVQGDTTTVLCASLASFYNRVPVGHVEAGLRTGNLYSPWPEEVNRVLTTRLAALHFAPTEESRQNLLKEGIDKAKIIVTGNTVIDALFIAREKVRQTPPQIADLPRFLQPGTEPSPRMVLITGHRRENFGEGFRNICEAIVDLAAEFPDTHFVYPVHLNPKVQEPVHRILRLSNATNVHLIPPLPYLPFVGLMERSSIILTDSGGIQEEAPSLGKRVLVMRDTTERPEALQSGSVRLVGADRKRILNSMRELLSDKGALNTTARTASPYGDGNATRRILDACRSLGTRVKCSLQV